VILPGEYRPNRLPGGLGSHSDNSGRNADGNGKAGSDFEGRDGRGSGKCNKANEKEPGNSADGESDSKIYSTNERGSGKYLEVFTSSSRAWALDWELISLEVLGLMLYLSL
jgi:hypothetical protein